MMDVAEMPLRGLWASRRLRRSWLSLSASYYTRSMSVDSREAHHSCSAPTATVFGDGEAEVRYRR